MDFCDSATMREREIADIEYEERLRRLTNPNPPNKMTSNVSMREHQRSSVLEQSRNLVKRTSQLARDNPLSRTQSPQNQPKMQRISVAQQQDPRRGSIILQGQNSSQLTRRISALADTSNSRRGSMMLNHK